MLKIAAVSLNPTVGDLENNVKDIIEAYELACKQQADIVLLPELVVCGYPPQDLLDRPAFLSKIFDANNKIIKASKNTTLIFGSITPNQTGRGRSIFNTAIIAENGQLLDEVHKSLLPTYDVFDEARYFEPAKESHVVSVKGARLGLVICEDFWINDNPRVYTMYDRNPLQELAEQGVDAFISMSASPYVEGKTKVRTSILQSHAKKHQKPMIDINQAGANTELIFDGCCTAVNKKGEEIHTSLMFCNNASIFELDVPSSTLNYLTTASVAYPNYKKVGVDSDPMARRVEALKRALYDYLDKTRISDSVILGLSGGIDSALVCTLAVEALGADKVKGITMPSHYSSQGSVSDSQVLANNLGVEMYEIPIKTIYDAYENALQPVFEGTNFGIAEENLQSRSRAMLLMAYSNKFGNMLLNTGNKSEMAVGYCTLYGDMNGGLALIADLYKTEVFEMCRWLNASYYKREVIPTSIIDKAPSAELRPDQKDTDSLPEYDDLDRILRLYIEGECDRKQIIQQSGLSEESVNRICRLVDIAEYKRFQAPPVVKISAKTFGNGRRWPIVSKTHLA